MSLAEPGDEPAVVIAVREAVAVGEPTLAVADPDAVAGLSVVLADAGLDAVRVVARDGSALGGLAGGAGPVLVHDPLCPATPAAFLARALAAARAGGGERPVVAVRPMTDTVKVMRDGHVTATVDRAGLRVVASPVVLPPVLAADLVDTGDVPGLVAALRRRADPELLAAPPLARRVRGRADLRIVLALRDLEERDARA